MGSSFRDHPAPWLPGYLVGCGNASKAQGTILLASRLEPLLLSLSLQAPLASLMILVIKEADFLCTSPWGTIVGWSYTTRKSYVIAHLSPEFTLNWSLQLLIRPKLMLANDGNYYEMRYVSDSRNSRSQNFANQQHSLPHGRDQESWRTITYLEWSPRCKASWAILSGEVSVMLMDYSSRSGQKTVPIGVRSLFCLNS